MAEKIIQLIVSPAAAGKRLDVGLTELLRDSGDFSRSQIGQWIADGLVKVNDVVTSKPSFKPAEGDQIELNMPDPRELSLEPQSGIPFGILFEDEDIIVIDKPRGLLVHPGAGQRDSTLVNALLAHLGPSLQQIGDALRPGIVHRLDKDTTGAMVVAKSELAYRKLRKQLEPPRAMKRIYLGLVYRVPKKVQGSVVDSARRSGTIDLPIGRHPRNRTKMAVVPDGKPARTSWSIRESFAYATLLELQLETGRTHQIRVHLAHCGAPLCADPVYGRGEPAGLPGPARTAVKKFARQALHSSRLVLTHPRTGAEMVFDSPLPDDFRALLGAFRD